MLSNLALLPSVRVPVFPHGGGVQTACTVWAKQHGWHRRLERSHIGLRDGTASYRGGEITSSQAQSSLGYSSVSPLRPHSRSRPSRAATTTRRPRRAGNLATALSVMSWNAGGLSAQQWLDPQEWATTCPYHVLCVQETHWSGSSQFKACG